MPQQRRDAVTKRYWTMFAAAQVEPIGPDDCTFALAPIAFFGTVMRRVATRHNHQIVLQQK
jgi:hypothetical protein